MLGGHLFGVDALPEQARGRRGVADHRATVASGSEAFGRVEREAALNRLAAVALQASPDQQRRDLVAKGDGRRWRVCRRCEIGLANAHRGNDRKLDGNGSPRGCRAHAGAPEPGLATPLQPSVGVASPARHIGCFPNSADR